MLVDALSLLLATLELIPAETEMSIWVDTPNNLIVPIQTRGAFKFYRLAPGGPMTVLDSYTAAKHREVKVQNQKLIDCLAVIKVNLSIKECRFSIDSKTGWLIVAALMRSGDNDKKSNPATVRCVKVYPVEAPRS